MLSLYGLEIWPGRRTKVGYLMKPSMEYQKVT